MSQKHESTVGCSIITIVGIAFCLSFCISLGGGCVPNYSEGQRSGQLIKMSKKGIFWQSYEGEVVLNDFKIGADGSNLFSFSSLDPEVGRQAEALMGKRVTVKYHQYFLRPIQQSTGYTVTEIIESK